jgi:hypothetical protein
MKNPRTAKSPVTASIPPNKSRQKDPLVGSTTTAKQEEATLKRGREALESNPTDDDARATLI